MAYALDLADEAADDLRGLIESLPSARRRDATDAVENALLRLAANPRLAQAGPLGRLTYRFSFVAGGVHYHWECTWCYSQDEEHIVVTHIYRVAL